MLRTGAPWRDLPEGLGKWNTVHRRFRRWANTGVFKRIFEVIGVFAYLDPPYPQISRKLYVDHRDFDHVALRDYLVRRPDPWALSINDLPEPRELY